MSRVPPSFLLASGLFAASSVATLQASAAEVGNPDDVASVDIHAFASQGFILTTGNDYLTSKTTQGSFQFTEVGINFTKDVTDKLRIGVQLFAENLSPLENFNAKMDWFYLDYHWQDWLGFRAGRIKIPYGLYNEIQDIDAARVPVLLPQSVYPLETRNFLFAQDGAEIYGYARSDAVGAVDYNIFAGTIYLDLSELLPASSQGEVSFNVPMVAGERLIWETPLEGLRFGGSAEAIQLDATATIPNLKPVNIQSRSLLWVGSAEYQIHDLVLTAEYSRWRSSQSSDTPAISPYTFSLAERGYAMATYRVSPLFQPGVYYSVLYPDVHNRDGRQNRQLDAAATLRFDFNHHWLLKLEGHYMSGTAGLVSPFVTDVTNLQPYWAAFFVKTTGYF